ncbi:MAG: fused MFS/spermidine synthase, partial [Thermodesulfobacteriota bacterium]
RGERSRALLANACALLSGAAALAYEVAWIRGGALVFGSASLATSTLLAVFFAGLALGSWLAGRLVPRITRPMRLYAGAELALAALAIATPALLEAADPLYGAVHRALPDGAAARAVLRALLIAAVILPPTVLIGTTLPLLCSQLRAEPGRIVGSVGLLYGVNTLGAALGCFAAGLVLIPGLGTTRTILAGAAANVAAALLALAVRERAQRPATTPHEPGAERGPATAVLPLAFGAGFAVLAYEVLWTRFLALVVRSTVTTYTLSLTAVLLGIVAGSLVAGRLARGARDSGRAFGALQMLAGLYVLALLLLPPAAWQRLGGEPLACLAAFLPAAVLSGATFPLAVRAAAASGGALGAHVGRVSAANTSGGIAGSLAAGFAGLPVLGLQASLLVATAVSVAVGLAAWMLYAAPRARARTAVVAAGAVAAWLAIPGLLPTRVPADFLADGGVLVAQREGNAANVAVVRRNGVLELRLDRWWQGEDRRTHQVVAAHLPMLLHPQARSVLVVGAGTGQTASRFLIHPIERLDVVEIEPAVFDVLAEHFDAAWSADPRVGLLRDDGRNVLRHSLRRWDVISLEVGQLLRPGVASFYTEELYRDARARLREGGLLCQFVPLAFLEPGELRRVVATFRRAFPASLLWYNTSELLLIGVRGDALPIDPRRFDAVASDPLLRADLDVAHWGDRSAALNRPDVLLAGFLAGERGLAALAGDAEPYVDDLPVLEHAAGRADRSRTAELQLVPLVRAHLDAFEAVLSVPLEPARRARLREQRERNLDDLVASALARHADETAAAGDLARAGELVVRALEVNPDNVAALRLAGSLAFAAGATDEARRRYEQVLHRDPHDALALRGLGRVSLVEREVDQARTYYERTLAVRPDDAETHNNLGAILASRHDYEAALVHFRAAARLDPRNDGTRDNLARLESMLGRSRGNPDRISSKP